jgi:hypothetical protein
VKFTNRRRAVRLIARPAISRMALKIALLFVYSCGNSHAQECAPQTDQYIGVILNNGRCFPWRKKQENLIAGLPRCKPGLKGRLESPVLPKIVNGDLVRQKNASPLNCCVEPKRRERVQSGSERDSLGKAEAEAEAGRMKDPFIREKFTRERSAARA